MMLINAPRALDMKTFQVPTHLAELDWTSLVRDKQRRIFVLTSGRKLYGTLVGHCAFMLFILPQLGAIPYQVFTAEIQEILLAPGGISLSGSVSTPGTTLAYLKQASRSTPTQHWVKTQQQRYYRAQVKQDLLGDWVLTKAWGSTTGRGGRVRHVAYASATLATQALTALTKLRTKRGYEPQFNNTQADSIAIA